MKSNTKNETTEPKLETKFLEMKKHGTRGTDCHRAGYRGNKLI